MMRVVGYSTVLRLGLREFSETWSKIRFYTRHLVGSTSNLQPVLHPFRKIEADSFVWRREMSSKGLTSRSTRGTHCKRYFSDASNMANIDGMVERIQTTAAGLIIGDEILNGSVKDENISILVCF